MVSLNSYKLQNWQGRTPRDTGPSTLDPELHPDHPPNTSGFALAPCPLHFPSCCFLQYWVHQLHLKHLADTISWCFVLLTTCFLTDWVIWWRTTWTIWRPVFERMGNLRHDQKYRSPGNMECCLGMQRCGQWAAKKLLPVKYDKILDTILST